MPEPRRITATCTGCGREFTDLEELEDHDCNGDGSRNHDRGQLLIRRPLLSLLVIVVLGLGIAAATALLVGGAF